VPTPQFNVRVPDRYHDLLRLIVDHLRANPDGADALAEALSAVCRQTADSIGADNLPTPADSARLDAIDARLAALEQRVAAIDEAGRVTGDIPSEPPAQRTHTPKPPRVAEDKPSGANGKRRPPRPWTEADDAELLRIFDQGGTQADACREMNRPSSVISRKWWELEKPASPDV
jgi:hypothetical protein